jgi:hypothetical protein
MTESLTDHADRALARLAGLGPVAELGLRFSVVAQRNGGTMRSHTVSLSEEAGDEVAAIAERTRARVLDATQLDYGPAVLIPPGHCMRVPQGSAATLSAIQSEVDRTDAEVFDAGADYAARASIIAARFSDNSGTSATFYRVSEPLLQFRKRKVLGLIFRNGYYDRLEPGEVLLMRSDFDVIVVGDVAFFFAKTRFEQAFGFLEELQRSSGETFDTVTAQLRIKGIDELRAACTSQPQMMAKMASIRRSMTDDPEYARAMTMPKLTRFVRDHPQYGIEVEGSGRAAQLVFNAAPATRFKILNLLDDDYLRSILTERDYEAGSKIRTPG